MVIFGESIKEREESYLIVDWCNIQFNWCQNGTWISLEQSYEYYCYMQDTIQARSLLHSDEVEKGITWTNWI